MASVLGTYYRMAVSHVILYLQDMVTGGGAQGDAERDLEEGSMELIYDPKLGVFFDPKTNAFFMREPVR